MTTTEIRTDPITGRTVAIDLGPFKRRDDFELGPILARVSRVSGLEWGSGIHRNPVSPEEAAQALRTTL